MIRSDYLGFLIFVCMMIIFFVLPDPEGLQKPFRIGLGLLFVAIYFSLLIKKEISHKTLYPIIIGGAILLIFFYRGTIQTSFINAYLCLFGLICMPNLFFDLSILRRSNLSYIHTLAVFSILVQFMIFSSNDGRPRLDYEINLSGAYLFLFFLASNLLNYKHGKMLIIALSLLTLSRLLIYSILLFYIIKYGKKYLSRWNIKINFSSTLLITYALFAAFSLWYVSNIKSEIAYETGIKRISNLNDGSNELRFIANTLVLGTVFTKPLDPNVLLGFGPVENFISATKGSLIMPHNELLDAIVQFGLLTVLFFAFTTLPLFNRIASFNNVEYLIPLLFYTLILWVRYLIVPSFEMLFILFMLYIAKNQQKPKTAVF